jgi:DNA invertase Pin-like site-specific DNA recombinase
MKFISYLRVSTQRQGHSGLGIEAQRTAVQQYLNQVEGELADEYIEVESGSRKERPILVQSIAQCRRDKCTLLIAKLDRLGRNVAFVSSLMESGVEFVAVDAPYANRLMIHILAAFAEHERMLISERTKAALAAAKNRGVQLGVHGAVLASCHKREAHEFAETLRSDVNFARANGANTLAELSVALNSVGRTTREGRPWRPSTTSRLVRRLAAGEPPGCSIDVLLN